MENGSAPAATDTAPVSGTEATDSQDPVNGQPTPAPKNVKKFKLKVDGQEVEEEVDLADEEGLKRHLQMSKAAQKRMSEAAKARREAEELVGMFKGDLKSVLKQADKLGKSPDQVRKELEEYFAELIEDEMLSDDQRAVKKAQQIIREREEETKRHATEREEREKQELMGHYAQDYDRKITEALSVGGVPKTQRTVKRMAQLMHKNLEMGLDLEPQHIAQLVREDYLSEIKELFGASDGDTLLKMLGDETANKIRKADLARLKSAKPAPDRQQSVNADSDKPQRRLSTEEWMAEVRRRARS
jgi:hypothetical protein